MGDAKRYRIPQNELDGMTDDEKLKRRAKQKVDWNKANNEKVLRMRKDNIEKTKATRKIQIAEHRANNPLIFFTRSTLARIATEKAKAAMELLPYSQEAFILHIEGLFLEGMNWGNRSDWHIDHIKPLSVFVSEGVFDLNTINALSNLRPLWAKDNLTKWAN